MAKLIAYKKRVVLVPVLASGRVVARRLRERNGTGCGTARHGPCRIVAGIR